MSNIKLLQDRTPANEFRAVVQVPTNANSFPKNANDARGGTSTIMPTILVDAFGNSAGGTSVSNTPTVSTTAYTANTEVGAPMSFSGISGTIKGVTIAISGTQTSGFNLYFFNPPLTGTYADKAVAAPSAADIKNLLGVVSFSAPTSTPGLSGVSFYTASASVPIANATSGVEAVLVTTGTPTFASATSVTVSVQT